MKEKVNGYSLELQDVSRMTKTRYDVYDQNGRSNAFITTLRNCEEMINILRDRYEKPGHHFKITRTVNGECRSVYSTIDKRHWDEYEKTGVYKNLNQNNDKRRF